MLEIAYIYHKENLENVIERPVQSYEHFEENKRLYFPDYNEEIHFATSKKLNFPILDNSIVREMTDKELIEAGKKELKEGEYLEGEVIIAIPKPNDYSVWDKSENIWKEDKALKLQHLKDLRYSKQQEYVKYKKELESKEEEKNEFEELGFDISETEERITEINDEMDLLKKEITKLSKEIKTLEKEVKE